MALDLSDMVGACLASFTFLLGFWLTEFYGTRGTGTDGRYVLNLLRLSFYNAVGLLLCIAWFILALAGIESRALAWGLAAYLGFFVLVVTAVLGALLRKMERKVGA